VNPYGDWSRLPRRDQLQDTRSIFAFAAFLSAGFAAIGVIGERLGVVAYGSTAPHVFAAPGGVVRLTDYQNIVII